MSTRDRSPLRLRIVSSLLVAITLLVGTAAVFWLSEKRASTTLEMYKAIDAYHLFQALTALEYGKGELKANPALLKDVYKRCSAEVLNQETLGVTEGRQITVDKAYRCVSQAHSGISWDIYYVSNTGYNGEISVILGIEGGETLRYVAVLNHKETVGYGERLLNSNNQWLNQLVDKPVGYFHEQALKVHTRANREFDVVSGATITGQAMINLIAQTFSFQAAQTASFRGGDK